MSQIQYQQSYASFLRGMGDTVTLRRASGVGAGDYTVRARVFDAAVMNATPQMAQTKRKAILLAEDVASSGFPVPFLPKQDRMIFNGINAAILSVDDATCRVNGVLMAYNIELAGA